MWRSGLSSGIGLVLVSTVSAGAAQLKPCEEERLGERAECGVVTVLEDRSQPEGRTIDLEVVVLRAAEATDEAPIFALAGGPGQGATDLVELALGPWEPVLGVRDIVLVDQRGTGGSNRLDCPNRSAEDPASAFGKIFDPANIRACLERAEAHADVTLYGTPEVVADLDEVRRALGYERVILWGGSGGTRTALVWARRYPETVEAMMLDGVTPTDFRSPSTFARSAQQALDRVLADCADDATCKAAFPDLEAELGHLLARFDDGPIPTVVRREDGTEVPVEMHRGDFGYALRAILYNSRRIARLPKMIHDAEAAGDVSEFAQQYWQRDVALRPVVAIGVHLAVVCSEDVPFLDRDRIVETSAGTFLGTYLVDQYSAACAAWRAEPVSESFLEPVRSSVPTLLISGYYDPSTPASMAQEVADHLSESRHVVVRNEAHGAEFGCAREATLEFLSSGSLEGLGPICDGVGGIEFAVD